MSLTGYSVEKNGVPVIESVELAATFLSRLLGLMCRNPLPQGHAMHLSPCTSVHTFLMRFPLDLVFLDSENRIVKIAREVPPFRVVFGGSHARSVLELTAGWLCAGTIEEGDTLRLVSTSRQQKVVSQPLSATS